ncbi:MAG TPA: alpha/beta fold hydrolase [Desulfobacterales bacterium]|jgi:pimeloyl-ACP methyl ester carboxylesterase|nr:alpha/beta fold hydrolase [Desulfobacterales bacterium]
MLERTAGDTAFLCGRWPLDPARPTLVFIHGAGESSVLWPAQVEGLSDRANTLALDLPGHGRSGGSARDRVPDYARAVLEFVDALGAPRPVPCGLSMGGAITQQLLLDVPGRFPAGVIVSSGARLRVLPSIFEMIRTDMAGYVALIDRLGFSEKTPAAVKRPFLEDSLRAAPEAAAGDFGACDRFDVMARLGEIRTPVLVVSAEEDRLTPPKYADFLEAHIPGARRARIRDAGHFAPIEKPGEVNAAIRRFLDDRRL